MVVEVATHDDRGMRVLLGDVFGDVDNLPRSILQVLLLSWLDVVFEHLNSVLADLQLGPTEVHPMDFTSVSLALVSEAVQHPPYRCMLVWNDQ